ncbi:MAG: tetratricopeptide repeat protein [Candidatus Poribacteria bacterium]|nr:tetratricopeptide repeat protein [Candidatus Poribacteria bacterium]
MKTKLFWVICTIIFVYPFFPSISTFADQSENIQQIYHNADDLYNQTNFLDAITLYTEALEVSKKPGVRTEMIDKDFNTLVNFKIAVSYSRLAEQTNNADHYNTAIEYINKVAATATIPKHQQALTYLFGHVLYRTQQYELAEEKFIKLIVDFPDSLQVENAWYSIGQLNYKLGDYEKTRSAFRNLLAKFHDSDFKDDAQLLIAQTYFDEENYESAYPEFVKLTSPEFKQYSRLQAETMYKAAYCLFQLDRYDEAIHRYANFIKEYPLHYLSTVVYFDLGNIYTKQLDHEKALVNYRLAFQSTTNQELKSEILATIGESYFIQADYENAIATYTELIKLFPSTNFVIDAKLGIADSHFRLERWNEAISAYREVIEYVTNDYKLSETAEHVYIPYSLYQVAESFFKFGTDLKETNQVKLSTTSLKQALTWYQSTVDNFPNNKIVPQASYGIIWTLNELERYKDIEILAQRYIKKYRTGSEFDILAAKVQLRLADIRREEYKQYVEAAREYAMIWDYPMLPKFNYVKLMGKYFEGMCYFEAAIPEGYLEGDPTSKLNADYLNKSVVAFQEVIQRFSDENYLPGVNKGVYKDFPERVPQVEESLMNEARSHKMLGNLDAAWNCYTRIPETSEYYRQAQLLMQQLSTDENVSDK